jgi:hypothetical protein
LEWPNTRHTGCDVLSILDSPSRPEQIADCRGYALDVETRAPTQIRLSADRRHRVVGQPDPLEEARPDSCLEDDFGDRTAEPADD